MKDYKQKIIEEDGLGVKKGEIADYPNQVSAEGVTAGKVSPGGISPGGVSPRASESTYQSEKIQLINPKLGEKLMSQQLLECVLVRNVMIYCKPFDQEVIHSFMKVYQFMQEKFPHIKIFVDDWMLEEINNVKKSELCT